MHETKKETNSQIQRRSQWLSMGWGKGSMGLGSGRYNLLGVRYSQGYIVQMGNIAYVLK